METENFTLLEHIGDGMRKATEAKDVKAYAESYKAVSDADERDRELSIKDREVDIKKSELDFKITERKMIDLNCDEDRKLKTRELDIRDRQIDADILIAKIQSRATVIAAALGLTGLGITALQKFATPLKFADNVQKYQEDGEHIYNDRGFRPPNL